MIKDLDLKLEKCVQLYQLYKPMVVEEMKWLDELPKGITIDYPVDSFKLFEESIILICDVTRGDEDVLGWWMNDDYTEADFIEDILKLVGAKC